MSICKLPITGGSSLSIHAMPLSNFYPLYHATDLATVTLLLFPKIYRAPTHVSVTRRPRVPNVALTANVLDRCSFIVPI
jgi:hypothetical protein